MITAKEYFYNYLSWQMSSISSSNLNPRTVFFESFGAMHSIMLEMEAEHGHPGAIQELGERYLFGLDNFGRDVNKAREFFLRAAELGNPEAYGMLSRIYMNDQFGQKNMPLYFEYLTKGAERGGWLSMFNLSCAYYKGREQYEGYGFDRDKAAALMWSQRAHKMTKDLLEIIFTNPCSKHFQEYMQNLYRSFVQTACISSEQLINGDGVKRDMKQARTVLQEAQDFNKRFLGRENQDFTDLLQRCRRKLF